MKKLMIRMIRFYKRNLSPLKPPCCKYYPTCSSYAIEAIEKRGAFVGFFLTLFRILRCNPFSKGGYDPVPEKGEPIRRGQSEPRAGDQIDAVERRGIVIPPPSGSSLSHGPLRTSAPSSKDKRDDLAQTK